MSTPGDGFTVTVDQDPCMGSGYCIAQYPELFEADADGTAIPRSVCPASAMEVRSGN